ncbi:MAG: bifunctional 3-demethylubiquinone-9 3-methyltransferase/2-octaprenyl-6-hydroxy phenol methylase [Verrucomicrobia bacterium]|nr:bifunctional 3-demethylubiquinone-9 3-methyltransferase/2-octaprenyl-6-hydroxy phenol methylase [Verrucomicrobiota bacterium]
MPKKILYESAVHQFLWAGRRLTERWEKTRPDDAVRLGGWISALTIENPGPGLVRVAWRAPQPGEHLIALRGAKFYTRGDAPAHSQKQQAAGLTFGDDVIMEQNAAFFDGQLREALIRAGVFPAGAFDPDPGQGRASARKHAEEVFHDEWAASVDVTKIDVRQMNEACTAPEMRHIRRALGDLHGRTLLDVGCGLGEASVYFALLGADVTATDISPGMCDVAVRLGLANGVVVKPHVSASEDLGFDASVKFDVIYTGNTLHHVDLAATMPRLLRHLKPDGVFVSWDPLAYNPVINLYRRRAMQVRTVDEHPLALADVRAVRAHFRESRTRWFWLTTLLIFCLMAVWQRRDPNRERYWKKVIEEADRWAWLYWPLAALDRVLLLLPFLRPLCWNVVIVGRGPLHQ